MQNSPLQLEDYDLKELRFALVSPLNEPISSETKYDPIEIEIGTHTLKNEADPLKWRCQVTVRTKDEAEGNFPYTFSIMYVGFFRVLEGYPADRIEQMVRTNAPALLYSAAREALVYLTGRGRLPPVLLPSITFLEPPRAQAAQRAQPARKVARKK